MDMLVKRNWCCTWTKEANIKLNECGRSGNVGIDMFPEVRHTGYDAEAIQHPCICTVVLMTTIQT